MRLTIANLLISGANGRGTERSASILARMPQKMNPPYVRRRTAAEAAYQVGGVKEARRLALAVVPAESRDDKYHHTAILRCRTGAPAVKLSAASMMALASMPWWR